MDSPLGKESVYPQAYAPELLLGIPRDENRGKLGLAPGKLPFFGMDLWNAYELSWLDAGGKPQVATGRFSVPCDSPNLVESKSMKLYLNSLNQEAYSSRDQVSRLIAADLSQAAGAEVKVDLSPLENGSQPSGLSGDEVCLDAIELEINSYSPTPSLLNLVGHGQADESLVTHLFRSNCPITNQPDWASVRISYRGPAISHQHLLAYLISFRLHNDYHENCIERIFMDIQARCRPDYLCVAANFLRRGGLDINPIRASEEIDVDLWSGSFPRLQRQ